MNGTKTGEGAFMAVTFEVADTVIGVDARHVEEIVRVPSITPVRGARNYELGIVNLRGRIITVIDMSARLGLGAAAVGNDARILVTSTQDESVGILVPKLSDVVEADHSDIRRLAGEVRGVKDDYFVGVFEKAGRLTVLLDPEKALGTA
jgi:purine-binding chemotaxis protein CheW